VAGHADERKRAIGVVRSISNVINNNKEANVNLISSVVVLICSRDAEPGGTVSLSADYMGVFRGQGTMPQWRNGYKSNFQSNFYYVE